MLILAHRGASRAAQENTVEAFEIAARFGADGVELDVRRGPTGELLVHHDALPTPLDPAIITLTEALDACAGLPIVNVEIKNSDDDPDYDATMSVADDTIAELRRREGLGEPLYRWLISSFSRETVDHCRAAAPELATAWLTVAANDDDIAAIAGAGHQALHPMESTVTADLVDAAHAAGLAVNVWTCNDPERIVELASMGVDAVCTDVPDIALAALGRGDQPKPVGATS